MDQAMAAAKYTHMQYCDAHKHIKITDGEHSIRDIPLIDSPLIKDKKFKEFFHLVKNVSSSDYQPIVDVMNSDPNRIGHLPDSVQPRDALGDQCKLQLVIWPNQDNDTYTALKLFPSKVSVPLGLAKAFSAQEVKVLNYVSCDNSGLVKKVMANSDGDMKWDPGPEELKAGMEHIKNHDSPIYGWPHHIVGKACANRATGNSQSEPEYFFPLLLRDLNSEFQRTVVSMILPTMLSFGLIVLGKPGIGKTPAAIIMVMGVARFLIQSRNMDGFFPGWLHIHVILDDPLLPSINVEDIKSCLDVGENGLVDARYRAAKFVRNQCRVLLNNEWCPDKESEYVGLFTITWKQRRNTYAAVLLTIAGAKDFRRLRIPRRSVVPQPQQPQVLPMAAMPMAATKEPTDLNESDAEPLSPVYEKWFGIVFLQRGGSTVTSIMPMKRPAAMMNELQVFETHLKKCSCGGNLSPSHEIEATHAVPCQDQSPNMEMHLCASYGCRLTFGPNFSTHDSDKVNTA
ncbi:unnamed protein product [Symbiodinium sp. KB8]|nr:unnamed protein product [Symbiodinium sp. KB8]